LHILVLQETDWLTRGPHIQHHIFERISLNNFYEITVLDYDIDKIQKYHSLFIKTHFYHNTDRSIKGSKVSVIRTSHLQIPYFRRISSLISNFFQILKLIRKKRIDVIVNYSMTNGLIGLLMAKLLHIPFIFHYIDILHELVPISFVRPLAKIVTRILFKFSDTTLVYTKLQENKVINEGVSPKKVIILPNGVSLENTVVNKEKFELLKRNYSIRKQDFIIFFMGYLYDFAGLKEIIDRYHSEVVNGKFNLKFIILGDGGIYNSLLKHVNQIGAKWVIMPGRVPFFEISEYIELADLCLLSFKINDITREITPIKIIEYLAMKKPVLSNMLPGVFLEFGKKNGVIYSKNQEDLIEKISDLIPRKKELKEIGKEGYKLVEEKYVWPKIIFSLKKIILDLIRTKRK
jgi:glycosyltransferase involved in cell wall biosynthesis